MRYLEDGQNASVSLCRDESPSSFTCFLSSTAGLDMSGHMRMDAMCYGQLARYDVSLNKFRLEGEIRPLTLNETAAGVTNRLRAVTACMSGSLERRIIGCHQPMHKATTIWSRD